MKGKLIKIEERWMVGTVCYADIWSNYIPLHPDDEPLWMFAELNEEWKDKLDGKEVEFEIVEQCCTPEGQIKRYVDCKGCDKKQNYAKLIPSKEQQKQLITEIMDLDAKDGLYEDEVDKLAHQYNPVMKLDAEFIRAGFKAGYKKAKETLPKKETQYLDEMPNVDKKLLAKMWEDTIPRVDPKRRVFLMNAHGVIDTRESKQETTIEEAAENYGWRIKTNTFSDPVKANELAQSAKQDFMEGAKWYREQLKKENEV
jgi:hypothetical protein